MNCVIRNTTEVVNMVVTSEPSSRQNYVFTILCLLSFSFLANVNSRSHSLYAIARPSVVCLSSVTFVRPTQAVQILGNISTALGASAIR